MRVLCRDEKFWLAPGKCSGNRELRLGGDKASGAPAEILAAGSSCLGENFGFSKLAYNIHSQFHSGNDKTRLKIWIVIGDLKAEWL